MKTNINLADIEHITQVYKLKINERQKQVVKTRLERLLSQVKVIKKLHKQTEKLEEITNICQLENVFRKDKVKASLKQTEVLSSTNKTKGGYIKTVKVLE